MTEQRRISKKDVAEKAAVQKKAMTEADFQTVNPAGHRRDYRPDGSYTWANNYQTNDGGKPTRVAHEINRGMAGFIEADGARVSAMQAKIDRVKMRDADGGIRYIEPGRAGDCATRNGWGHSWRAGGLTLMTGLDGMEFRAIRGAWEATGYALVRGEKVPIEPIGVQRDPDGNAWAYRDGEWRLA